MQTFLPYPNFTESARCLDRLRLGKQRVEAIQILRTLQGRSAGWANHPAVLMWKGYESALALYGWTICDEWRNRGYVDNCQPEFRANLSDAQTICPSWLGNVEFHHSHQSNLVRKLPEHYSPLFPNVPNNLPYIWPTKN